MAFLDEKTKKQISSLFTEKMGKVTILLFTQPDVTKCQYCSDIEELYGELAGASDKIELQKLVLLPQLTEAKEYGILELAPATVILDSAHKDTGIRFYGVPAGYEFTTLVETLLMVSSGITSLKESTVTAVKNLKKNIDLKVFVSLSCPYCPAAVHLAHQLAFVSGGKIKSGMIESAEFPFLANKYSVMGVPKTVINETGSIEGAAPEEMLIEKIVTA